MGFMTTGEVKKLPWWGKAAVAVAMAAASWYGIKGALVDSICSSYHVQEGEMILPGTPVGMPADEK